MQDKSDLLMQELLGELATKTMVIYQQTRKEKQEKEEDLRFEMLALNDKIEDLESARDRLLEELKQEREKNTALQAEVENQKSIASTYSRLWHQECEKNTKKPDAATSDQEASK
ncbi:MAG: hypothetical protein EOM68_05700 [Spirochaetia bacterium]|nr:hypothetical protein [Spirochaetia bacterium]